MLKTQIAHTIASAAQRAVLYEVTASPKPGLVDRYDAGAHKDMDFYTFMDSSAALYKGFFDCAEAGAQHHDQPIEALLTRVRPIGIATEQAMFQATQGINTHKGVLFSLGLTCAACGWLKANNNNKTLTIETICETVKQMTSGIVARELDPVREKPLEQLSHGEKLYAVHGIAGVRGEVASGFETIQSQVLSLLREMHLWPVNDWLLEILLRLMQTVEDSNVIYRGGMSGLQMVQAEATAFVLSGGMKQEKAYEKLSNMNERFTDLRLSPGGAADLLSVAVFLAFMESL